MNNFGEKVKAAEREEALKAKRQQNTKATKKPKAKPRKASKKPTAKAPKPPKPPPPEKVNDPNRNPDGTMKPGCPVPNAPLWQPGQSGNPGGRPKRKPISDAMRAHLDKTYSGSRKEYKGMTNAEVLAIAQFELAVEKGDMRAAVEIADRVEGRVPQEMQHGGTGDGVPIPIDIANLTLEEKRARLAAYLVKATNPHGNAG